MCGSMETGADAMTADFDDLATSERQALINSTIEYLQFTQAPRDWAGVAAKLADDLLNQNEAILMALHWLRQGAPGRAVDELQRVLNIK